MNENAKRFLEELDANEKAQELLKAAAPEDPGEDASILARVARETGYEISDDEMREFLDELQKRHAATSDAVAEQIRVLNDAELDAVAGGGSHGDCKDTYKDNENCWWEDNCKKVVNFYYDVNDPYCDSNSLCSGFMTKPDCKIGKVGF